MLIRLALTTFKAAQLSSGLAAFQEADQLELSLADPKLIQADFFGLRALCRVLARPPDRCSCSRIVQKG